MSSRPESSAIRAAVERRLARRHRSEMRFKAMGRGAILLAIGVLCLLLFSIGSQAMTAFTAYKMALPVTLEASVVDPRGDGSEESLRRGAYTGLLQQALREQFPHVEDRGELRELFALYTPLNASRLLNRVVRDPGLVGETIQFEMPISDDVDLYFKGEVTDATFAWPAYPATLGADGGQVTVSADANVFSGVVSDVKRDLLIRADALDRRAERLENRAAAATDEGRAAAAREDAARSRAQAVEWRRLASPRVEAVTLTPDLPSVLIRINGGVILVERIENSGRTATGQAIIPPDREGSATDWSIWRLETPAASRRVTDRQIVWAEALRERGVVRAAFNDILFLNADSREPELAGVLGAMIGSLLTMTVTILLAVPIGVATAIYLEEFAPKNRWTDLIEVNINNLAAVPSIVFGLLGLAVFINLFGLPRSAPLVGGMVLALMTLPTVIISTRAALKAVPPSIREAALGVGASKTQMVFHHVLPLAAPGVLTGSIIGLAQALGETAPLLMIGMVAFIADAPSLSLSGFTSPATVMPVQVYLWSDGAERAFEARTAAAIVVLLGLMVILNAAAVYLRHRFERRW